MLDNHIEQIIHYTTLYRVYKNNKLIQDVESISLVNLLIEHE